MASTVAGAAGGTGSAMTGDAAAADAVARASRSYEVQLLAARIAACADRADAALVQLAWLELQDWQSPAGQAYRTALSLQAASLRRSRDVLQDAAAAVRLHAGEMMLPSGRPGY